MKWSIQTKTLICPDGKEVSFPFPIMQIREVDGICIVVLDVPPKEIMTENVFGVSVKGNILWQIERTPETATNTANSFVEIITFKGNTIRIATWTGLLVDVEVKTGHILNIRFGK